MTAGSRLAVTCWVVLEQLSACLLLLVFIAEVSAHAQLGSVGQPRDWKQLFNGKDLTGWTHIGQGSMSVAKGLMRTNGGPGLLYWNGGKIGHCVLRITYRMEHENDNSGVFIRISEKPTDVSMPMQYAYEVQIDNHPERSGEDEYHSTGTLYSLTKPLVKAWRPGPEWNTLEIAMDGPRTIVMLNGVKVTDYREGDRVPERKYHFEPIRGPRPEQGWIALQNHSERDVVLFREVAFRPMP
jgi:hypothetical protein